MTRLPLRDPAHVEAVQAALPEGVVAAAAVLTWLGDPILLLGVVAVYRWHVDRPGGRTVLAAAIAATGLTIALKTGIGLPRPPASLHVVPQDGFGVPSGHALGATAVWGALALAWDGWSRRKRLAAAAGIAVLVSATRVAIGVHYALDVLTGVAAGAGLLVGYRWWAWGDRRRETWLAAALAVAAVAVAGPARDPLLVLGAAAALLAAPRLPLTADGDAGPRLAVLVVGLGVLLALAGVSELVPAPVALAVGAAVVWWILAAPAAIARATARI